MYYFLIKKKGNLVFVQESNKKLIVIMKPNIKF
jgi:hypothetical protein